MIHRKWSLLTGAPAMIGSMVATLVVANYVFGLNDTFLKPDKKKENVLAASSK